jgi:2-phosphoglycerate kinase
VIHEY